MADASRIEDLRRRIDKDPASILFAQLGEELRRAGHLQEAVEVCRAGLAIHPTYLSARVTLGRALLDLSQFDEAEHELREVMTVAPDNLAASRALTQIRERRGQAQVHEVHVVHRVHQGESRVLSVLEQWLDAIHVARAHPVA